MISRWSWRAAAAAVVFGGGSYLATPAEAAMKVCSDAAWAAAIDRASQACGSQASIVADCVDGELVIREIYCY